MSIVIIIGTLMFICGCHQTRLTELEGRVDLAGNHLKTVLQQKEDQTTEQKTRVDEIRKQLEAENQRVKKQQDEALARLENLKVALSRHQGVVSELQESDPEENGQPLPSVETAPVDKTAAKADPLFQAAYAEYARGAYDQAIQSFQILRESNKQGASRARIEYYIGESYYSKRQYTKALTYFSAVEKYAMLAQLVAPSLWKRAMCYHYLRLPARKTEMMQQLVKKYPDSEEAGLARDWLAGENSEPDI